MTKEEKAVEAPEIKTTEPKGPPKSTFREYFESFTVTLIMAIFGMTFILQAVTVPTGSMQNTILIGDYLLVNKFIFSPGGNPLPFLPMREIRRGDIIVFKYPGNRVDPESDRDRGLVKYQINYVKRVIGLPGETVEFRNNQVFINGELLPEQRLTGDNFGNPEQALEVTDVEERPEGAGWEVFYSDRTMRTVRSGGNLRRISGFNFGVEGKPMQVPENSFFVMGDSRDQSDDSRGWGFVPRELVIGRAMFVYWSCDRAESNGGMAGCLTHPRLDRIGKFVR
ncbi:MAG: signal peptidase I [Blastocatellia bacterium]|nr:signal peptidase I [Blastocatellia bacterium]